MRVLGIIPARYGSERMPGKALLPIGGQPMVVRVYQQVRRAEGLTKLLVATDDTRIAAVLQNAAIPYCMTATQHPNGSSRCWEAYNQQNEPYDAILNIQGDEPFLQAAQIETLLALIKHNKDLHVGTLIKKIVTPDVWHSPHAVKVVCDTKGQALYFSRSSIPHIGKGTANQLQTHTCYKHIGLYAYRPTILKQLVELPKNPLEEAESLEQLRWMAHGYRIQTAETTLQSTSIDTPESLQWALKQGLLKEEKQPT